MRINLNKQHIYFLIKSGKIVYVGQSRSIIQRIFTHSSEKCKSYDSVEIYEHEGDLDLEEFKQIAKHKPKLNKSMPALDFALRTSRVNEIEKCLLDAGINPKEYYDTQRPDFSIKLNDKYYHLWAKKGLEDKFFEFIRSIEE